MDTNQTREIEIPDDLLAAVFPDTTRPEAEPISMFELATDAIRVREIKGELARTQADLPALEMECDACEGTGNEADPPLSRDPQDMVYIECRACDGFGRVPATCEECGTTVGVSMVDGNRICAGCRVEDEE